MKTMSVIVKKAISVALSVAMFVSMLTVLALVPMTVSADENYSVETWVDPAEYSNWPQWSTAKNLAYQKAFSASNVAIYSGGNKYNSFASHHGVNGLSDITNGVCWQQGSTPTSLITSDYTQHFANDGTSYATYTLDLQLTGDIEKIDVMGGAGTEHEIQYPNTAPAAFELYVADAEENLYTDDNLVASVSETAARLFVISFVNKVRGRYVGLKVTRVGWNGTGYNDVTVWGPCINQIAVIGNEYIPDVVVTHPVADGYDYSAWKTNANIALNKAFSYADVKVAATDGTVYGLAGGHHAVANLANITNGDGWGGTVYSTLVNTPITENFAPVFANDGTSYATHTLNLQSINDINQIGLLHGATSEAGQPIPADFQVFVGDSLDTLYDGEAVATIAQNTDVFTLITLNTEVRGQYVGIKTTRVGFDGSAYADGTFWGPSINQIAVINNDASSRVSIGLTVKDALGNDLEVPKISGSGIHNLESLATLSAPLKAIVNGKGYKFVKWTTAEDTATALESATVGDKSQYTFTVSAEANYVAHYAEFDLGYSKNDYLEPNQYTNADIKDSEKNLVYNSEVSVRAYNAINGNTSTELYNTNSATALERMTKGNLWSDIANGGLSGSVIITGNFFTAANIGKVWYDYTFATQGSADITGVTLVSGYGDDGVKSGYTLGEYEIYASDTKDSLFTGEPIAYVALANAYVQDITFDEAVNATYIGVRVKNLGYDASTGTYRNAVGCATPGPAINTVAVWGTYDADTKITANAVDNNGAAFNSVKIGGGIRYNVGDTATIVAPKRALVAASQSETYDEYTFVKFMVGENEVEANKDGDNYTYSFVVDGTKTVTAVYAPSGVTYTNNQSLLPTVEDGLQDANTNLFYNKIPTLYTYENFSIDGVATPVTNNGNILEGTLNDGDFSTGGQNIPFRAPGTNVLIKDMGSEAEGVGSIVLWGEGVVCSEFTYALDGTALVDEVVIANAGTNLRNCISKYSVYVGDSASSLYSGTPVAVVDNVNDYGTNVSLYQKIVLDTPAVGSYVGIKITLYHSCTYSASNYLDALSYTNARLTEFVAFGKYVTLKNADVSAEDVSGNALSVSGVEAKSVAAFGEDITFTAPKSIAVDGVAYELVGWKNMGIVYAGTDNGENNDYTTIVTDDMKVAAIYKKVGDTKVVTFADASGKFLAAIEVATGSTVADTVADMDDINALATVVPGYEFTGWDNGTDVEVNSDMTYVATYTAKADTYTVVVTDAEGELVNGAYAFDTAVVLSARGDNFSYWKSGDTVLSADKEFTLYVPGNITVEAVYNDSETVIPAVSLLPIANKGTVYTELNREKYDVTFFGNVSVPTGAEFVECGILLTTSAYSGYDADDFVLNSDSGLQIIKIGTRKNPDNGAYMATVTGVKTTSTRYARGYMIYAVDGVVNIAYSDSVVKVMPQ